jgi:hypothetical protein
MSEHTIRISNSETGEVIDRPMTAEEIAEHEAITAEVLAAKTAKEEKEALRIATLAKLGLTAEEAAALLT